MPQASSSTLERKASDSSSKALAFVTRSAAAVQAERQKNAAPNLMVPSSRDPGPIIPTPRLPPTPRQFSAEEMERHREQELSRRERERAQHAAELLVRSQKLWEISSVPPRFLDADFSMPGSELPPAQVKVVDRVRDLLYAPGMLAMVGTRGTGKTWTACATIREFCRLGRRARYVRTMEVFRLVRGTFSKKTESERDVIGELTRPELLVLDEIQVRSESEFENNTLIDLIDQRYAALKSTVLIANLEPDALLRNLGSSIENRLREDGGILLCDWESYRTNGKAMAAAPPDMDHNREIYAFTPVSPGAEPSNPRYRTVLKY